MNKPKLLFFLDIYINKFNRMKKTIKLKESELIILIEGVVNEFKKRKRVNELFGLGGGVDKKKINDYIDKLNNL